MASSGQPKATPIEPNPIEPTGKNNWKNWLSAFVVGFAMLFLLFGFGNDASNQPLKDWVLWAKNKAQNDNSENWACHNYAYNLMMTAEKNAIFMTEGGDNQVFSLLYFSYVERIRPDIDFYDQKGNVFPRLYGDLMRAYGYDLRIIRSLRDFQLFSVGRPVYLTWKREDIETLRHDGFQSLYEQVRQQAESRRSRLRKAYNLNTVSQIEREVDTMTPKKTFNLRFRDGQKISDLDMQELGPWFFKQYGILYKVVPMRYAPLEALRLLRTNQNTKQDILNYINRKVDASISKQNLDDYIEFLLQEGLVEQVDGDEERFALTQPETTTPFPNFELEDYWSNYLFDYKDTPNAIHWDYLTREIFHNYNNLRIEALEEKKQIELRKPTPDLAPIENETYERHKALPKYGHDMPNTYYKYAAYLQGKGRTEEAIEVYSNCAKIAKEIFDPYFRIGQMRLRQAQNAEADLELDFLEQAEEALKEAKERFYFAARKSDLSPEVADRQKPYLDIVKQMERVAAYRSFPKARLEALKKKTEEDEENEAINEAAKTQNLENLFKAYQARQSTFQAVRTLDKLAELHPKNINYALKKYEVLKNTSPARALSQLEEILSNYNTYASASVPTTTLHQALISTSFNQAERYYSEAKFDLALEWYEKANGFVPGFMEVAMPTKEQPEVKARIVKVQQTQKYVGSRIELLKAHLNKNDERD